jgi:hypothetical protein
MRMALGAPPLLGAFALAIQRLRFLSRRGSSFNGVALLIRMVGENDVRLLCVRARWGIRRAGAHWRSVYG